MWITKGCKVREISWNFTHFPEMPRKNVWYVSDKGSDDNDCSNGSTPCKNLQTVLDRADDGADIYVTSDTLSLDNVTGSVWLYGYYVEHGFHTCCQLNSSLSYSISSLYNTDINFTCSGWYKGNMCCQSNMLLLNVKCIQKYQILWF